MTWVNSANSSDPWGKYYKHFPTKINEPTFVPSKEDSSITNLDVEEFIQNVTEEQEDTTEETLTQQPQDENLNTVAVAPVVSPLEGTLDVVNQVEPPLQGDNTQPYVRYTNP